MDSPSCSESDSTSTPGLDITLGFSEQKSITTEPLESDFGDVEKLVERLLSEMAARTFQFVEPLPKEVQVECSICLSILCEPYIVECCGSRFCKKCIERTAQSFLPCPLCMSRSFRKIPDKQLQRLLDQRKVFCLLKDEGCSWTGEMGKLEEHLKLNKSGGLGSGVYYMQESSKEEHCEFAPISCPLCEVFLKKENMSDHLEFACTMRKVKCEYCEDYSCPAKDLLDHHVTICPSYPMLCQNRCTLKSFKRKDLEIHTESECPLQGVVCEYGCEAVMLRKEMPDHVEKNVKEHLSMVSSKYKVVVKKFEDLEVKCEDMKTKLPKKDYIIYVSNLSEASDSMQVRCRFYLFGAVTHVEMIPSHNAALIHFASESGYTRALTTYPVNLHKRQLVLTPIIIFFIVAVVTKLCVANMRRGVCSTCIRFGQVLLTYC